MRRFLIGVVAGSASGAVSGAAVHHFTHKPELSATVGIFVGVAVAMICWFGKAPDISFDDF